MPLIYFASQTGPALEVLLAGLLCFYGMLHFFSTLPGLNHRRLQAHLLFSLLGTEISHFSKHPGCFIRGWSSETRMLSPGVLMPTGLDLADL